MFKIRLASGSERAKTIENNHVEWGKPLTLEDYFYRENELEKIVSGALETWILLAVDSPGTTTEILAQCETYERQVKIHSRDKIAEGMGYGIASVFVSQKYRGKGYGKILMRLLKDQLKSRGDLVFLSHLYSDIGPKFYRRLGWSVFGPFELSLTTANFVLFEKSSTATVEEIFVDEDLKKVMEFYNAKIDGKIRDILSRETLAHVIEIPPTVTTIKWFRRRAEIFAKLLPSHKHIRMESQPLGHFISHNDTISGCLIYFHDFKGKVLSVLMHGWSNADVMQTLLNAAYHEAKVSSLDKVEIWNPDNCTLFLNTLECSRIEPLGWEEHFHNPIETIRPGLELKARTEESLPSLCLFESSLPLECDSSDFSNLHWIGNEKFAWI